MLYEHKLRIDKKYYNPYFREMALSLWEINKPVIYPNDKNEIVERHFDGKEVVVKKNNLKKEFDKRYEQPFEDDGAYAD